MLAERIAMKAAVAAEERVLVLAPTGVDADLTCSFLERNGVATHKCDSMADLAGKVEEGCAAVILAEEALDSFALNRLVESLATQPSWSELPIAVITSTGEGTAHGLISRLAGLGANANVTLLERPFRPITLVNAVHAALRSRRRQYQVRELLEEREQVLRSINDAFVTMDLSWRCMYVNEKAAELVGRSRDDLIGANLWDLFPGFEAPSQRELLHRAVAEQRHLRFEYFQQDQSRWHDVRIYPSPRGVSILMVDITDRKQAEEKLEAIVAERTARLRDTIGELEAFSYSISHDLRSPLRAMQAYSEALLEDFGTNLPKEGHRYVERIAGAAVRLDKLITDVLAYSQVLRAPLSMQPIDLDRLVRVLIEQYPTFQPYQAHLRIQGSLLSVMGHEGSLTQCITNLISNALKFVPAGRQPEVRIWTEPAGDQVKVFFADNGIGIGAKDQTRIFGMFQRLHPEKHYEGTGIGLAIVRKAVERMGGTIGLDSTLGEGTRFWIQLPRAER
jgi:PAS domain S-box-containing protein